MPGFVKRRRAHDVALREFTARGLTRTRGRTGVLLYVALQERYAEIVADTGIDGRVEPETWRGIIAPLLECRPAGPPARRADRGRRQPARVLAHHAPPAPDDVDELPNKVVLL